MCYLNTFYMLYALSLPTPTGKQTSGARNVSRTSVNIPLQHEVINKHPITTYRLPCECLINVVVLAHPLVSRLVIFFLLV